MRRVNLGLLGILLLLVPLASEANEVDLIPLVPDHVAFTISRSPTICWILMAQPAIRGTVVFTLMGSRNIRPVLESKLPDSFLANPSSPCKCVNLKDYGIQLETEVQYRWYISIQQNPESPSKHVVGGGVIERCDLTSCGTTRVYEGCSQEAVIAFAQDGLWYDAVSCLCGLVRLNPDDKNLRRMLRQLLKDIGVPTGEPGDWNPELVPLNG